MRGFKGGAVPPFMEGGEPGAMEETFAAAGRNEAQGARG